ncbi:hypothetical protein LCGC14_2453240, partial [marine sediment metagenome]
SKYEPLGADVDGMDGLNTHGAIIDELHAHKSRLLWDKIVTSTAARRQPLTIAITTAGYDRNSVCWNMHERSVAVLERTWKDDTLFAYICALDEKDRWDDERVWHRANPNYGVSVKVDNMREQCREAKRSPAFQNTFRRLRLNQWTEQADRWLDMDAWNEAAGAVDRKALAGRIAYGGFDLSSVGDLTSFNLLFPFKDKSNGKGNGNGKGKRIRGQESEGAGERYKTLAFFWIPEERMQERVKRDRMHYDVWADQGFIRTTPGNVVDYDFIREDIRALGEEFNIREIGVDPWNATGITTQLTGDGFNMVQVRQHLVSLTSPMKYLLALTLSKRIEHGANPVLDWCAGNLAVEQDATGNIRPSKARSREKIDGMSALITALARAMVVPAPKKSVYATRGIKVL